MHRRINFLSIAVLLAFVTLFSVAIHAQEKFRISRPTTNIDNSSDSPTYSSAPNTNTFNNINNNGSDFRLNLNKPDPSNSNKIQLGAQYDAVGNNLTQVQLQKLAAHDIVLIIDKSGSMSTADCPTSGHSGLKSTLASLALGGGFEATRWQWCRQQISQLSLQTQQVLPRGFTVLLFDSGSYLFPHVNADSLIRIFSTNNPGGSTNLTLPLNQVFNDYFKRQKLSRVKIKPLLIGIVTDGCPDDPRAVKRLLADTTHSLQNPQDITIVFFLIGGHDSQGEKFARNLSQDLTTAGASFNIVKYVPFNEVLNAGLVRCLADNLE